MSRSLSSAYKTYRPMVRENSRLVEASWNVMAHGDAREGK